MYHAWGDEKYIQSSVTLKGETIRDIKRRREDNSKVYLIVCQHVSDSAVSVEGSVLGLCEPLGSMKEEFF